MKAGFLTLVLGMFLSSTLIASCSSVKPAGVKPDITGSQSIKESANGSSSEISDKTNLNFTSTPDKKPMYGSDSAACVMHYNLYRQSFRDWENSGDMFYFEDLIPWWTWVFVNCPGYRVNTFINGVKIYEHRITIASENEKRGAIDTLLMIFDERILYFGDEPFVLGQKAAAVVKHCPEKTEDAYELLSKVVKLNKLNTPNHLIVFYMQYAVNMHQAGKLTLEELIDIYIAVDEIANHNVLLNNENSANYKESIERIEQLMLLYLDCKVMQDVFMPKYIADSTNMELCRKIIGLMAYKNCYDQPVFRSALAQLNKIEPTPKLLMIQGNFMYNDGNYSGATDSYTKAFESFTDKEQNEKYQAAIKNAEVYLIQKQYQNARTWVIRALSVKSDDPDALIFLGDIYFQGSETCGSSFRAKYSGYWAAFDKYQRARSLSSDPNIQSKASNGQARARSRFPNSGDIHFNGERTGTSFMAPCWINETVTIRASDS